MGIISACKRKKYLANIILCLVASGLIIFYSICGDSCVYLQGSLFGLDLQYTGLAYMAALVALNLLKKDLFIVTALAAGVGVEFFLVGFQVKYNTYCPYCLFFGMAILLQFILNFDWSKKWLMLLAAVVGFAFIFIFFQGSATPVYS